MLCFMIVGLKNSIPCVIKSVPEKELSGQFIIKDPLIECLKILHEQNLLSEDLSATTMQAMYQLIQSCYPIIMIIRFFNY